MFNDCNLFYYFRNNATLEPQVQKFTYIYVSPYLCIRKCANIHANIQHISIKVKKKTASSYDK